MSKQTGGTQTGGTQAGGRLLGSGVYGCTFDPAPRCAGGKVFRQISGLPAVGKVTVEDSAEELGIGREIMKLPLAQQYFALPTEECNPAPIADPDAGACPILKEAPEGAEISMLVMPAAGQQLLKWSSSSPDRLAASYMKLFVHLLEGIVIYQKAGFVHNDIHMGNILIDEMGVSRFIDFGLAFRAADVKDFETANLSRTFRPKYIWQAPEVHAWRMFLNGVRTGDGVKQLQDINPEYLKMEHQFPSRKTAVDALTEVLSMSEDVRKRDFGAFARKYAMKFDSWRIGLCMWFLWDDLLHWYGVKQSAVWAQRDVIRKALSGLTDFDVRTRLTAGEALAILKPTTRMG
jgi:hypothetical protein